ncbi:hypothetical protein EPUL_003471 [Erysiphe pulchra]|uniref:Integrase catalytic domain-containing protein n=1 Tax=Erysiphe pulchra TaxID=225359 RepID=A0A2S4PT86_9PEZI|nr:hypothetical protein EPUL_003471 [Erysiphe pulchra]
MRRETWTLDRYDDRIFHRLLVDTDAAGRSTVGVGQFKALQQLRGDLELDKTQAGKVKISGIGACVFTSIGAVVLNTPIGQISFHLIPCNIPFLLRLSDMKHFEATPDVVNIRMLKNGKAVAQVFEKYGHLWMTLGHFETLFELRIIHRRWGHPSATRMWKVLQRAGHDAEFKTSHHLTKFFRECQLNANRPLRFKFTLRKDNEFNHTIYVGVVYLEDGPCMHVIDAATAFTAAEWLAGVDKEGAEEAWNAIRRCWIDVYIGPPEHIVHDAGKNFASSRFRRNAFKSKIEVTTRNCSRAPSCGNCSSSNHTEDLCMAATKCRNCRGPRCSNSRQFLARQTRSGASTKEQLKTYPAEESAPTAEIINIDALNSQLSEVDDNANHSQAVTNLPTSPMLFPNLGTVL